VYQTNWTMSDRQARSEVFLSNMGTGMDSQVSILDDWYCQDVRIDVSNIERFHVKTDSS
jgi:hypothetical protein